ncbi:unnamed protein product [Rotaria socialis]|uniref:Uncharacterized protein n=2 Tax=Rotaria socialis TaxID=392032 RepID=A0A820UCV1_9BILA|nr:unnamed protein product [Rotaria socialis]
MERCSFEEMNELIRSSSHSATPAVIDCSKTDHAIRNTMNKCHESTLDNIRDQFHIFSDRLAHVEQSKFTQTFINNDSRPAPSRSVQIENSTAMWSENLQAQEEISRLKLELAIVRSQINNNQSTSHSIQPLPLMSTQTLNYYSLIPPTHVLTNQLPHSHRRSSTSKPIQNLVSDDHINSSQVRKPTEIITPNVIRSSRLLILPTILVSSLPSSSQDISPQFSTTSQSQHPTSINNAQLLQQYSSISTQNDSTNTSFDQTTSSTVHQQKCTINTTTCSTYIFTNRSNTIYKYN